MTTTINVTTETRERLKAQGSRLAGEHLKRLADRHSRLEQLRPAVADTPADQARS